MKNTAKQIRNAFKDKRTVRLIGAHDALGARLIEKHGFDGIWLSGLALSTSYALPDAGILTMSEYLRSAQSICLVSNLPIIVDGDTGFGGVRNIQHMVKNFEFVGVAGVCIEDKIFPKTNSFHNKGQALLPIDQFVDKIKAAKDIQTNDDFLFFARTEALIAGAGMNEALDRAHNYYEAGADVILIHSKQKDGLEVKEFLDKFDADVPVAVIPTTYYTITFDMCKKWGADVVVYANQCLRGAFKTMEYVLKTIREDGSTINLEDEIATIQDLFAIQGIDEIRFDD